MPAFNLKRDKSYRCFVIFFLLFIFSTAVFAQDSSSIASLRQIGKAFAGIAEKASPAVVGITAKKTITKNYPVIQEWPFGRPFDPFEDDFFDFFRRQYPRFHSPKRKYQQTAQGSGFIISKDGYILTNHHLVGQADEITVKLVDNREYKAKLIGSDPESEVAVIKIEADDLPLVELADSDKLEVGEWVIAIGNPFGLRHTVTAGIVSAKGRSRLGVTKYEDFIQTDAAINPGNSGGPLLNLDAKVVGINTAIVGSHGNIGIGLAIPINMAKGIYQQLVDTGTVVRGYLGVWLEELTPELAKALNLEDTKGVAVSKIEEDSPADKAGIKPYDVIVELDGEKIENGNELRNRIAMTKPGTEVKIVVIRDGKYKNITVELGELTKEAKSASGRSETMEKLGLTVEPLTNEAAKRLGYEQLNGVIVSEVEPGSPAAEVGIKAGVLILEVNRQPVANIKEFDKEMEKAEKLGSVLLLITDGRYGRLVVLPLNQK